MSRHTESVCRLCRREGMKLFLKGDRCFTEKCAIERRQYAPGQHGQAHKKQTEYAVQLREKQKVKRLYGLTEEQFRVIFANAERMRGVTGENLMQLLEERLDNVVYRCGFAASRQKGRQLVLHGHVKVNGRRVAVPSYRVKPGDELTIADGSRKTAGIAEDLEGVERKGGVPEWLQVTKDQFLAKVVSAPERSHITLPIQEERIVELYSK